MASRKSRHIQATSPGVKKKHRSNKMVARSLYIAPFVICSMMMSLAALTLERDGQVLRRWAQTPVEPFMDNDILHQLSFAMSFLLVFRSSRAHERWLRAKELLLEMQSAVLDFYRHCALIKTSPLASLRSQAHMRLLLSSAFHSLVRTRKSSDCVLADASTCEMDTLSSTPVDSWVCVVSNWVTDDICTALNESPGTRVEWIERLDTDITRVCSAYNSAQFIARTSIPSTYTYMLDYILYFYILMFPLSIGPSYGVFAPFISALYTFVLVMINRLSIEMEHPFSGDDMHDIDISHFMIPHAAMH